MKIDSFHRFDCNLYFILLDWNMRESFNQQTTRIWQRMQWIDMHIMFASSVQRRTMAVKLDVTLKWVINTIPKNLYVVDVVMLHEQKCALNTEWIIWNTNVDSVVRSLYIFASDQHIFVIRVTMIFNV